MDEQKSLLTELSEAIDRYRTRRRSVREEQGVEPLRSGRLHRLVRWLTPNGGTLLLIVVLILTQKVWAKPLLAPAAAPGPSATTVNYQGRLADSGGSPLSGTYGMSFSLWDAATGGNLAWGPESHAAVPVSDGLFSVGLGSQTNGGIPTNVWDGDRYLEITVGGETLSPRELIRSVPIAGMALTVPDGAIGIEQIADGAVTQAKAPFAAEAYWGMGSAISQPGDMKVLAITYVFTLQGGQPWEEFFYDISSLGFSERPHAVCQLVNCGVETEFCHCDWDGSTSSSLMFWLRRYDGGNLPQGPRRVNIILFGC